MQLRDWKNTGVEDLTLIESLVAQNDPEPLQPGHDYQQLALDREKLASNRLRLAKRFQEQHKIPLKVLAMQKHPDTHEQSPFFQKMRDQPFNLRCHQPCIIPPANVPTVFDERMRMVTLTRHHYFVPDTTDTTLATFSRVEDVASDVQASEVLTKAEMLAKSSYGVRASELASRASFPEMPNATEAWRDLKLRAESHESVPLGYKNYLMRDLADELSGSSATTKPGRVPLMDRLQTLKSKDEATLGQAAIRDELDRELDSLIQDNADAFNQGGLPSIVDTPPELKMDDCEMDAYKVEFEMDAF